MFTSLRRLNGPRRRASSEEGLTARSGSVRGEVKSERDRGFDVLIPRGEVRRDVSVGVYVGGTEFFSEGMIRSLGGRLGSNKARCGWGCHQLGGV